MWRNGEDKGDDNVPLAAQIDRTFVPILFNDDNMDFAVTNPLLQGSHITYQVKGVDRQGPWEGQRRYSHFHALHETLQLKWPGVFIPKIPPKKAIVILSIKNLNTYREAKNLNLSMKEDFIWRDS